MPGKLFKEDPYASHSKAIGISGPGDIRLSLDYDDVNHWEIDQALPLILEILNEHWDGSKLKPMPICPKCGKHEYNPNYDEECDYCLYDIHDA